jgi:aminoglycoside phosphotransferase (APT) family kinase protein
MVEVRDLKRSDGEPKGRWVCLEKKGDLYFLFGRANGEAVDPHVSPDGFSSAAVAIRAAITLADYISAPILYVRDGR